MENWMQRTELMIGKSGMDLLTKSSVLVVGLGGVGGMAAEMVVRAGIGHITIADKDIVNETNINRQIVALHDTLLRPKAEVMAERLLQINPQLQLNVINDWIDEQNTETLLTENKFDFVIDAIDTLSPKVFLIKTCLEKNIPIISSMGSGGKLDPSRVGITDISKTHTCALAKTVRQRLNKMGIHKGLPVVFSSEIVNKKVIIPTDGEKYKKSTTGTISYLPAVFGCFLTSYIIRELLKIPDKEIQQP